MIGAISIDFDRMSDDEIIKYIEANKAVSERIDLHLVLNGAYGEFPPRDKAFKLIRRALKEGKEFGCAYFDGESCDGPYYSGFEIWISESYNKDKPKEDLEYESYTYYNDGHFYKNSPDDTIFWLENLKLVGEQRFTFDKEKIYSFFEDYPQNMSKEEVEIFDRENPEWAEFYKKSGANKEDIPFWMMFK